MSHWVRISDSAKSFDEIVSIAARLGIREQYVDAQCCHGFTHDQKCLDCETGHSTDAVPYALIRSLPVPGLIAVSDDFRDVVYIPRRLAGKVRVFAG